MIFVDANLLLYVVDATAPQHAKAKAWWDGCLNGHDTVCLSWPVLNAFLRIATNPRIYAHPLSMETASDYVDQWLQRPQVRIADPSDHHWILFQRLLVEGQCNSALVTDAHLAALALENNCRMYSTDRDFLRFPELRTQNPLR